MRAVDRRTFCKLVGGGIVVLVTAKPAELFAQQRRGYPEDLNAYLRIDENGRVTLFSGKIEMGQGVHTSLAQMAAEELGVSLDAITMVMGDTDQCPWDAGTWGSQSTRMFGPAVRAGHRPREVRRRHAVAGNALRAHLPPARTRRDADVARHRQGEGDGGRHRRRARRPRGRAAFES